MKDDDYRKAVENSPSHLDSPTGKDTPFTDRKDIPDPPSVVEILGGDLSHDICQDAVREATGDADAKLPKVGTVRAELRPTGMTDTPMADGQEEPEGTEVPLEMVSLICSGGMGPDPALAEQAEHDISVEGAVRVLLARVVWEDVTREGLLDTPGRVVKALGQMTEGYGQDPVEILGTTFDTDGYDEMVVLRGIDFVSLCEHHMLPFTGTAAVGYVPGDRVVGLSKLARVVDCFARRLQIQERMTKEIADAVMNVLEPKGVGVVVSAHHSCMGCRGVRKAGADMVTSSLAGVMRYDPAARAEFLALAGVTGK